MSSKLHLKYLLPLLIIPLILITVWFRSGLIEGGGEEGIPFYNPSRTFTLSKSLWWDYNGGFPTLAWIAKTTFLMPSAFLFEVFKIPNFVLQALTFLILLSTGGLSMYLLTSNLLGRYQNKEKIALVASVFYIFNPFTMSQVWARGIGAQYFSFAILPLSSLIFLLGLKTKNYFYIFPFIFCNLIFSTAFSLSTFVMAFWTVITTILIYWIIINRRELKAVVFSSIFYVLIIFLWVITNLWWLLPLIISGNKIYFGKVDNLVENLGTLLGVSNNFPLDIIIRLLQKTYFFDPSAFSLIYSSLLFQVISWLLPTFLIIGLITIMRRFEFKELRLFIVLFGFGLVVSLGANLPFGPLFVWIFKQSPFLQSFRNPYEKFGLVYALAYSPIFAVGVTYCLERIFKKTNFKFLGLLTILFLICGIYAWPMWTGRVIAGPDKKVGLDIPNYYQILDKWLAENSRSYRVFMTPLWVGDGAFYQWNETKYQGIDPFMYLVETPQSSSSINLPFHHDFMMDLRKYMERLDTSASLALLRIKFLVDRKDSISITEDEKKHYQFLTSTIFPPNDDQTKLKSVCQNRRADSKANGLAGIVCELENEDLEDIRYLNLKILVDKPSTLDLAVRDRNEVRIRWYGKLDPEYTLKAGEWNYITIPLHAPSEYNSNIDFSKIYLLEIMAYRLDILDISVDEIILEDVKLDSGMQESVSSFDKMANFGKLDVFKFKDTNFPPEFGNLSSVETAKDFPELFNLVKVKKNSIDRIGFIVGLQNSDKDTKKLSEGFGNKLLEKEKISTTRYWIKLEGMGLIILSKTFHPEWKVIPGISKTELSGSFWDDMKFLRKNVLSEEDHFIVNGYANLWKVDSKNSQYAIIFMPQIIADIGLKISIFSVLFLIGLIGIWGIKKYIFLH